MFSAARVSVNPDEVTEIVAVLNLRWLNATPRGDIRDFGKPL